MPERSPAPPPHSLLDPGSRAGQLRNLVVLSVLLVLLAVPARTLSDVDPAWPAVTGLGLLAALYLAVLASALRLVPDRFQRFRFLALGLLAVVAGGLAAGYSTTQGWGIGVTYVAVAGALVLPTLRVVLLWLLGLTGAGAGLVLILGGRLDEQWLWWTGSITLPGLLTYSVRRTEETLIHLHQTQAELAGAAVEAERLRFSRDLHDLLGHTLSVIVVKAEVTRRLAEQGPPAAAAAAREAGEIEQIGRRALAEVREAVTGYRARPLAAELDAARAALADAGIEVAVRTEGTPLPAPVDALFGWVVREAVTNVVRHSRATRCQILVRGADGYATVEVHDDGMGGAPDGAGRGLGGLAERLAASGGTLTAGGSGGSGESGGSGGAGGWRLRAEVPV